jgi:hypothetical protein
MTSSSRLSNAIAALSIATVALVACDVWNGLHREHHPLAQTLTLIVPPTAQSREPDDPDTGPTTQKGSASQSGNRSEDSQANSNDDQDNDDNDDDDDGSFDPGDPSDPIPI